MGRLMNWAEAARNSGARLGPVDAIFAGLDYKQGKDEGEDDIRALGGAGASAAGSWAGAVHGGTAGAAAGSVFGPGGTVIGGAIGAIGGGWAGGNSANWAFDRADDFVRGSQNKAHNQSAPQTQQSSNLGPLAAGAGILGLGVAATQLLRGKKMWNPKIAMEMAQRGAVQSRAGNIAGRAMHKTGEFLGNPAVRAAGVVGGGYLLNDAFGNPIGGLADAATGGKTNFAPNMGDDMGREHEETRMRQQIAAGDTDSIYKQYGDLAALQAELGQANDAYSEQNSGWRQADREDQIFKNNIGKDAGNFNLKNQMIKGGFDHKNTMAAANAQNYWNNAQTRASLVSNLYGQRY